MTPAIGHNAHCDAAPPSITEMELALAQLMDCAALRGSRRLKALLNHLVRLALSGDVAALRETAIGNALYVQDGSYDPCTHSVVRVEARRLRGRLAEHYRSDGRAAAVRISIPTGSYVPHFTRAEPDCDGSLRPESRRSLFELGQGIPLSLDTLAIAAGADPGLGETLTANVRRSLAMEPGLRLLSDVAADDDALRLRLTLRRGVVDVAVADGFGATLHAQTFKLPAAGATALEAVAATLASRFRVDAAPIRRWSARLTPLGVRVYAMLASIRSLLEEAQTDDLWRALALCDALVAAAPMCASAYAAKAIALCMLHRCGALDRQAAADSIAVADQGLAQDPESVDAATARAVIAAWAKGDDKTAAALFRRAEELGGSAMTYREHALFLLARHQIAAAGACLAQARALSPISAATDQAEARLLYLVGDVDAPASRPGDTISFGALRPTAAPRPVRSAVATLSA